MGNVSIEKFFQGSQAALLAIIAFIIFVFSWSQASRNRRFGRSENVKSDPPSKNGSTSSRPLRQTLLLEGIRIQGQPHEVLGIDAAATEAEIQKAYKNLMKRFHPDRVGPPGSTPWKDAQAIAEALNSARQAMLAKHRKR